MQKYSLLFVPGLWAASVATTSFLSLSLSHAQSVDTNGISEFRSATGGGNNPIQSNIGETDTVLIRISPADYGDGTDLPRGVPLENDGDGNVETDEQTLPSARDVSNAIHDQGAVDRPSKRYLSQLFFQFGQFISHDTALSEPNGSITTGGMTGLSGNETFPVEVDSGDPDFGFGEISFTRTIAEADSSSSTGVREQINTITAYIDGSGIYGSNSTRADDLRSFIGGRLLAQSGPDGPLLPYNTFGLENANPLHLPETSLFAAGDVRANEQVGLIAFHTLFVREHNRLAGEIASSEFPSSDLTNAYVDEQIYQKARAVVGALLQKITYYEWLPAILGFDPLPPYHGYRSGVNPQIANEFSTAVFRIGHTMLPSTYSLVAANGTVTQLALQNAFFSPSRVAALGIDPILRGQAANPQQEIDQYVVDDIRNFLFGPGFGGLDLASLNIQRGRDHGIPSLHFLRTAYGLSGLGSFEQIGGGSDFSFAAATLYGPGNHRLVDAWTGGLSEPHLEGTNLGETFTAVFVDQFSRLRDGDRFYFENSAVYPASFTNDIRNTSFADIIRRNSGLQGEEVNDYVFFVPGFSPFLPDLLTETKKNQPDLRIGKKGNAAQQRGNDRYNRSGQGQKIRMLTGSGRSKTVYASLENDGAVDSTIGMKAKLKSRQFYVARIFNVSGSKRQNVTASMFSGRFNQTLEPAEMTRLQSRVTVEQRSNERARKTKFQLRSTSLEDASLEDTVVALILL